MSVGVSATMAQAVQVALQYLGVGKAKRITEGTVEAILSDGMLVVSGIRMRTSGTARGVRVGERVSVLWSRGAGRRMVPTAVLRHQQRAGAPPTPAAVLAQKTGGIVEELFFGTDVAKNRVDVFFRNDQQVTALNVAGQVTPPPGTTFWFYPASIAPTTLAWGEANNTFVISAYVAVTESFDELRIVWWAFRLNRDEGAALGATPATATLIAMVVQPFPEEVPALNNPENFLYLYGGGTTPDCTHPSVTAFFPPTDPGWIQHAGSDWLWFWAADDPNLNRWTIPIVGQRFPTSLTQMFYTRSGRFIGVLNLATSVGTNNFLCSGGTRHRQRGFAIDLEARTVVWTDTVTPALNPGSIPPLGGDSDLSTCRIARWGESGERRILRHRIREERDSSTVRTSFRMTLTLENATGGAAAVLADYTGLTAILDASAILDLSTRAPDGALHLILYRFANGVYATTITAGTLIETLAMVTVTPAGAVTTLSIGATPVQLTSEGISNLANSYWAKAIQPLREKAYVIDWPSPAARAFEAAHPGLSVWPLADQVGRFVIPPTNVMSPSPTLEGASSGRGTLAQVPASGFGDPMDFGDNAEQFSALPLTTQASGRALTLTGRV